MRFKKGDIVEDVSNDFSTNRYGLVDHIEGREVHCYWANTLEDLKNKKYAYDETTCWVHSSDIKLVKKQSKKKIKQFGIVTFCKKYYK
jgi:hypothetical protein